MSDSPSDIEEDFYLEERNRRIAAGTAAMRDFLSAVGADLGDDNLADTPRRVAKMFVCELLAGEEGNEPPKIVSFPTPGIDNKFVIVRNIPVRSLCAHHLMPITGYAHIGAFYSKSNVKSPLLSEYVDVVSLPGLSKYARVVDYFSRRFQLQERLGEQISEYLLEKTKARMVVVRICASHHCMIHRGVLTEKSDTITCNIKSVGSTHEYMWPEPGLINSREELLSRFNSEIK